MEIKCDKCGATLQYSPGTQNLVCEYCGHTVKLEDEPNPGADVTADEILPIKVDKDTAISMARVYMIGRISSAVASAPGLGSSSSLTCRNTHTQDSACPGCTV